MSVIDAAWASLLLSLPVTTAFLISCARCVGREQAPLSRVKQNPRPWLLLIVLIEGLVSGVIVHLGRPSTLQIVAATALWDVAWLCFIGLVYLRYPKT